MTKADSTYQNTKVQIPQGADRLSIDSDGLFDFFGETVTGAILKKIMFTNNQKTTIYSSDAELSVTNMLAGVNYLVLSAGPSNASAWLTSCTEGDECKIHIQNWLLESVCSIFVSLSGCTLVGYDVSDLSSISLHTSDGSSAWIHLKCFSDDEWSIVAHAGKHLWVERAIS